MLSLSFALQKKRKKKKRQEGKHFISICKFDVSALAEYRFQQTNVFAAQFFFHWIIGVVKTFAFLYHFNKLKDVQFF